MKSNFLHPGSSKLLEKLQHVHHQEDIIPNKKMKITTTQTTSNYNTIQKENPELEIQQLLKKRKTLQEEKQKNKNLTQNKAKKTKKNSTNIFSTTSYELSEYEKIQQSNINEKNQAYAALTADKSSLEATHFKEWVLKYIHSITPNQHLNMFELDGLMEFLNNNGTPYTQVIKLKLCLH